MEQQAPRHLTPPCMGKRSAQPSPRAEASAIGAERSRHPWVTRCAARIARPGITCRMAQCLWDFSEGSPPSCKPLDVYGHVTATEQDRGSAPSSTASPKTATTASAENAAPAALSRANRSPTRHCPSDDAAQPRRGVLVRVLADHRAVLPGASGVPAPAAPRRTTHSGPSSRRVIEVFRHRRQPLGSSLRGQHRAPMRVLPKMHGDRLQVCPVHRAPAGVQSLGAFGNPLGCRQLISVPMIL